MDANLNPEPNTHVVNTKSNICVDASMNIESSICVESNTYVDANVNIELTKCVDASMNNESTTYADASMNIKSNICVDASVNIDVYPVDVGINSKLHPCVNFESFRRGMRKRKPNQKYS